MNYAELTDQIQEVVENDFTPFQLETFVRQAEQKIYEAVSNLAVVNGNSAGNLTTGNRFLTTPTGFLYPHSISVIDAAGNRSFLVNKDRNFIHEAYPNLSATGKPKYYALYDEDSFIVGPAPDENYPVELSYARYPESIVTAGRTWLGEHFDNALLNGALVEALRFLKGESADVENYNKFYLQSIALLKEMGDVKQRQDSYRSG